MEKKPLTLRQQEVYDFIRDFIASQNCSPLLREIQQGCAIASYKSVVDRLNALERKSYISRLPNKHRGIKLVGEDAPSTSTVAEPAEPELSLSGVGAD